MIAKLLLAVALPLILAGPPRIAVQTSDNPREALALITADFHTDEDEARVYGVAHTVRDGRRVERVIALEKLDAHRYRIARSSAGTAPAVMVVGVEQGEDGTHGAAEALIRIARGGTVAGVDIPTERRNGHTLQRRITEQEIAAALTQVGAGAAD